MVFGFLSSKRRVEAALRAQEQVVVEDFSMDLQNSRTPMQWGDLLFHAITQDNEKTMAEPSGLSIDTTYDHRKSRRV